MVLETKRERDRKLQLIRRYSRWLLSIPFLFLFGFLGAMYIGVFRPSYIRKWVPIRTIHFQIQQGGGGMDKDGTIFLCEPSVLLEGLFGNRDHAANDGDGW